MTPRPIRPSAAEIAAARGRTVPDLIGPGLKVLFVGINPSLYSAVVGHHFARPGNRFWPALHRAGITPRRLDPTEEGELLARGYGITNVVDRATARADELAAEEYVAGGRTLRRKIGKYRPRIVAFLGIGAYRTAFAIPGAVVGRQPAPIADAIAWVLPSPSGLNAHYRLEELAALFADLRRAAD